MPTKMVGMAEFIWATLSTGALHKKFRTSSPEVSLWLLDTLNFQAVGTPWIPNIKVLAIIKHTYMITRNEIDYEILPRLYRKYDLVTQVLFLIFRLFCIFKSELKCYSSLTGAGTTWHILRYLEKVKSGSGKATGTILFPVDISWDSYRNPGELLIFML